MPLTQAPATRNTSIMPSQQPKSVQGTGTCHHENIRQQEAGSGTNSGHKKPPDGGTPPSGGFSMKFRWS